MDEIRQIGRIECKMSSSAFSGQYDSMLIILLLGLAVDCTAVKNRRWPTDKICHFKDAPK